MNNVLPMKEILPLRADPPAGRVKLACSGKTTKTRTTTSTTTTCLRVSNDGIP